MSRKFQKIFISTYLASFCFISTFADHETFTGSCEDLIAGTTFLVQNNEAFESGKEYTILNRKEDRRFR